MKRFQIPRTAARRAGVTLSEVLVSMLVMSLGVISVFTLFPIALLRSVQATQLSNATILRQNAEARVEFDPETIHGTYSWSANWNNSSILDPVWVTPTLPTTKDWRRNNPFIVFLRTANGTTGGSAPSWDSTLGNVTNDNGVSWKAARIQNYLVDPIGCREWANLGVTGNDIAFLGGSTSNLARMDGRAYDAQVADAIAGLPDAWIPVFSDVVTGFDNSSNYRLTIQDPSNLNNIIPQSSNNLQAPEYRALMFDITGKYALKETIHAMDPAGGFLYWNDPNGTPASIPAGFTPTRVQVDVRDKRYSWMLTVRKRSDGMAAVDAVVFFNRTFKPSGGATPTTAGTEYVYDDASGTVAVSYSVNNSGDALPPTAGYGYDGKPGTAGIDDDADGTVDETGDASEVGWPGSDDKRTITMTWTNGTDLTPFLKKGGYVLDARLGYWYRVLNFTLDGSTPETSSMASLVVDRDLIPMPSGTVPALMFFRGVVEVYPLGLRIAL